MTIATAREITVRLRRPHSEQQRFMDSPAKFKVVKAGRRGGKTVGAAILAVQRYLAGRRVLYAAPTSEQTDRFWYEVKRSLAQTIETGVFKCNETERFIERPGTENRIKAKTSWNANTLRGDYADLLILDEFQLMAEDTWDEVGAPMLADHNGDAVFIFTPPSLNATGVSKARDPRHASKMFDRARGDTTGHWATYHFTSFDNPYISHEALELIAATMSLDSYRREIMAEDDEIQSSWLVYSRFNESACKVKPFPIPPAWFIHTGHDFGSANPAALFLSQNPGTGDFYVYREYLPGPGLSTSKHVEAFQEITRGWNVLKRVGGNQTTEDEIRQGYAAHGWPITAPKLAKPNAQIDRVLGLMGLNKIFVFDTCIRLLTELANCMWVLDAEGHITDKIRDEPRWHLLAALRYIASDFTPETVEGTKLQQVFAA